MRPFATLKQPFEGNDTKAMEMEMKKGKSYVLLQSEKVEEISRDCLRALWKP